MTEKVYFESDFEIAITLPDSVGDRDFTFEFYTSGHRIVKFYRINGKLSSNLYFDDGRLTAVFCNHGLRPGKLIGRFRYNNKKDMQSVVRWYSDIELVSNTNVLLDLPELDLIENLPLQDSGGASLEIPVEVIPADANTKTITTTIIKFSSPITQADVENIKMITPNEVLFLGYNGGTYTISEDKLSIVIDWDFEAIEGEYELRIPKGVFMFENGNSNAVINAKYNVSLAPIEYFTPVATPTTGSVEVTDLSSIVVTLPSEFGEFNPKCDPWYDQMYIKYYDESLGYEQTLWLNTKSSITVSEDGLSITLTDWAFEFEKGVTYKFNIPAGYIVLANGAKNNETQIAYTVR